MKEYILLYGDKKQEDAICIKNMFKDHKRINIGWTDVDNKNNLKILQEMLKKTNQLIFLGLEQGWDKLIREIRKEKKDVKIKVICNTQESLLYYEYERENFFKLLQLSKENIIDNIAFLRKGQYELYKQLGYKCSYLRQNFILQSDNKKLIKQKNEIIDIGIYPLNYTWDKNIFNQLCIPKFVENSNLNYNKLDKRMKEFLDTMHITSKGHSIQEINQENIIDEVIKNDINISCAFTEYLHTVFFISMEQGIPCLIGNTSDLFEDGEELKDYIVTFAEDNAIINAMKVKECLKNKEKIVKIYQRWKQKYNEISQKSIEEFITK